MKFEILTLLSAGAKSDAEIASYFGDNAVGVLETIEGMESGGIIESRSRQVHEGNNVFRWDREYRLSSQSAAA
jgi:predicted transcriptional regulator